MDGNMQMAILMAPKQVMCLLIDPAVHGTIMHEGRGQACQTQPPGESRGFPVTVRHTGAATFPAQGTPAQTGHLRGEAGFVNEHQTLRIDLSGG